MPGAGATSETGTFTRRAACMKIYTKTGDSGETGLLSGPRRRKDDARIEAYGALDELNGWLGLARAEQLPEPIKLLLQSIQNQLFVAGAQLADPQSCGRNQGRISDRDAKNLEMQIDRYQEQLPPLGQFILPGGSRGAAVLHCARTVCRRAERRVVTLTRLEPAAPQEPLLRYLNRLGDLLFVLARATNAAEGCADVPWLPD
jgi:cob(I)alamin adenosyltransferase